MYPFSTPWKHQKNLRFLRPERGWLGTKGLVPFFSSLVKNLLLEAYLKRHKYEKSTKRRKQRKLHNLLKEVPSFKTFVLEGQKDPLHKICHTYPTIMKLDTVIPYLKKIQKYVNHVTHPLSSADINIFSPEISKFCYIKKYRLIHNF